MPGDHTINSLHPPLLTADMAGLGGRIKSVPEDFEVEEIPAYSPSGQGEFLYLWIEKRDLGAEYFLRQVGRRLGIPTGEVGMAGIKDRRAVTRQMISVPALAEERLAQLEGEGIRILNVRRHSNKLRSGHLHGNRFRILIRDISGTESDLVPVLERLREHGLPNYYGPQRFGKNGETLQVGMAMVCGQATPRYARNPFFRKLALSAVQSALFNHYLGTRLQDGLFRKVLPGDVMAKLPFGGMFVAEDVEREDQRFRAKEIVTAGPIFGRKTFPAAQEAAARENACLETFGLKRESFHGFGKLLQGTRRHNLVYLDDLTATLEPEGLRLSFTLPAGSYATVLLREITKTKEDEEEEREEQGCL